MTSSFPMTPNAIKRIKASDTDFDAVMRVNSRTVMSAGKVRLELSDNTEIIQCLVSAVPNSDNDYPVGSQLKVSGKYVTTNLQGKTVMMCNSSNIELLGMSSPDSIMDCDASSFSSSAPIKPEMKLQTSSSDRLSSSSFVASSYVGNSYTTPHKSSARSDQQANPVSSNISCLPINALNPYSNKWTIRARVTSKSEMKSWAKENSSGSFFSVELLDNDETAIKAMFWKDSSTKFFPLIEVNSCYYFTGGRVKLANNNSQYSSTKNKYELDFAVTANIVPCEDDSSIKAQKFEFVKIKDLPSIDVNTTVDILCIIKSASEVSEVTMKALGKTNQKRDLTIVDDSATEVRVTLWGEKALKTCDWKSAPIVLFKGLRVGEYGGRSLSSVAATQMLVMPDMPEARLLHEFRCQFADGVPAAESISLASASAPMDKNDNWKFEKRVSIASIKENDVGVNSGEKGELFNINGYVSKMLTEKDPWYNACPDCGKKILPDLSGSNWSCEKCQKNFEAPNRRYVLTISMQDYSGAAYFGIFNDEAHRLIGHSAEQIHTLKQSMNEEKTVESIYQAPIFSKQYVCTVKAKEELNPKDNSMRVKLSLLKMQEVDFVQQNKSLLAAINKYY